MEKMHWYCFALEGKSVKEGVSCRAEAYMGFSHKDHFPISELLHIKGYAGITADSILLGISYLGYMTKDEFNDVKSPYNS